MRVNGVPNKYEIFQDYYLEVNGKEISYSDALNLFYQMDETAKTDFEKYYKDETGYEIITANGISYGDDVQYTEAGTKKVKKHWKKQTGDGSFGGREEEAREKEIKIYSTNACKAYIDIKYTIDGYAKEKGIILDPVWSGYSAEEILQMANNGVNIPQDIVDIANTIQQKTGANYETADSDDENTATEEPTEKEGFLELIPKAQKKIEKCDETNDKINSEIEALLPEKQKHEKTLKERMEAQKASLKEYEEQIREWRTLQNKVNNGEALTDKEASRYAEITGMLEDKNSNSDDFQIDKTEIAKSLNQINILAVLGEELADETIEIGDTLADYTSKANYKATRQSASQEIGFLRSIIAMANGKNLAKQAAKTGNETKEYTEETNNSVNDIASLLGIENSIINPAASASETEKAPQEVKTAEETVQSSEKNQENIPLNNEEKEQETASEQTNDTQQEDFIITDDTVNTLIEEAGLINSDLAKQLVSALGSSKKAKSDKFIAKFADKKISKIVKEYQEEEARRQDAIKTKENENKEAKKELENLTGKSSEEIEQELDSKNTNEASDENINETDKNKVNKNKRTISDNNKDIENLNNESEKAIQDFNNKTRKEQSFLNKSIPQENEALENHTKYLNETIPQYKERLNFTENTGITLNKMGKYRVTVGKQQIMHLQMKKGFRNISKGTKSMSIGSNAEKKATKPIARLSEKSTVSAVASVNEALSSLTSLNSKIVSVTGEDTAAASSTAQSGNNVQQDNEPNKDTQTGAATQSENTDNNTTQTNTATEDKAAKTTTINTENNDNTQNDISVKTSTKKIDETASAPQEKVIEQKEITAAKTKSKPNTKQTEEEKDTEKTLNSVPSTTNTNKSSEKDDKQMSTDEAQSNVDDINGSAKEDSKDSENVKKDTDKTTKELEKETKQLEKLMKKDQKKILKMTKESTEAAKKQEEALTEFETLVTENEQLITEDENNQKNQVPAQAKAQSEQDEETQQGMLLGSASMSIGAGQSSNADKIQSNDERINELGISFNTYGRTIDRNRTKIVKIQKTTKKRQKKFNKKTDIIDKKNKEAEKKELEKQKRLQKQLGSVGIAENIFQITLSTGLILSANPFTAAAGAVMVKVGTYGVLSCGVTKATINIANGNLTAGLISLGQCAISLATSATGTGAAAGGVLGAVSNGLNVVASSAELVNNVRAVQGKEASGVFSKISTIAGVASSLTSSAATLSNLGKSGASAFGKSMQIAGVAGSALSSASQLMTEFGNESQFANILGMVGGAVSTMSAIGMLADKKFSNASEKNKENKEKTQTAENKPEQSGETQETKQQTKTEEKQAETEMKKAEQQAKTEEKQAEAEMKKNEQQAKTDEQKNDTSDKKSEDRKMTKEEKKAAKAQEKRIKNNIKKEGASEQFADINTEDLQKEMFAATDAGDTERAKALAAESTRRNYYKNEIAPQQRKENRQKTFSNVMNAVSNAANVAGSLLSNSGNQQEQQQKKKAPAGKLTQRTKEIMRKNKKRINALAAKGYNLR